jgi:hypothetical protein
MGWFMKNSIGLYVKHVHCPELRFTPTDALDEPERGSLTL